MIQRTHTAIALFSGGLDSILSVKWMQLLGYTVHPVFFQAPYIPVERAEKSARENDLELIVKDITPRHLQMMQNPVHGFGKNYNPCIDCHALMFEAAAELLPELGADFLISGEVLGQRPMSQRRNALQAVQKLSGVGRLIVRPLSQKLLPDTYPITAGWVDKAELLAFHGRSRTPQIELAGRLGLSYPAPGGGCLLTDRNFSLRLSELVAHGQADAANIRLLRWGRHFRLTDQIKLIVGRSESDNAGLDSEGYHGVYLTIRDILGPLGLLTTASPPPDILAQAASILLCYCRKAADPGYVKYGIDKNYDGEILVEKYPEQLLKELMISLD